MIVGRRARAVRRRRLLIPPLDDLGVIHGGLEGRFRCWRQLVWAGTNMGARRNNRHLNLLGRRRRAQRAGMIWMIRYSTVKHQYILYAGQHPGGGLRDNPLKSADVYYTLHCLAGLSSTHHHAMPSPGRQTELFDAKKARSS